MPSLRTKETADTYAQDIAGGILERSCRLCDKHEGKEFEFWKIITNDYPYDNIAKVHDMIVPKRHAKETELSGAEWGEFQKIKVEYLNQNYDYFMEPAHPNKSIPDHFHLHLIVENK